MIRKTRSGLAAAGIEYGNIYGDVAVAVLMSPTIYEGIFSNQDTSNWDKKDPDWRNRPVVCLAFEEPQHTLTPVEYREWNPEMPDDVFEWNYEHLPKARYLWVPFEQALEIIADRTREGGL